LYEFPGQLELIAILIVLLILFVGKDLENYLKNN